MIWDIVIHYQIGFETNYNDGSTPCTGFKQMQRATGTVNNGPLIRSPNLPSHVPLVLGVTAIYMVK